MQLIKILQFVCILIAAGIMGNWYLAEYRKAIMAGKPLYRACFTLPGILIMLMILLLPVLARLL